MANFIHQLPALVGVIIGAAASYIAGVTTERVRWKRERSSRWEEKRAQVYSDYSLALKNAYVQCLRIASSCRGLGLKTETIDCDEARDRLGKLTDVRTAIWESVLLLGAPKVVTAAREWHRTVGEVELFALGNRTDTENWGDLLADVISRRTRFYAAARKDLGIDSGDLPQAGPWYGSASATSAGSEVPGPGAPPVS